MCNKFCHILKIVIKLQALPTFRGIELHKDVNTKKQESWNHPRICSPKNDDCFLSNFND